MEQSTLDTLQKMQGIEKLVAVVAQLRHPTEGCPWDLKQTHQSLKPYMLEEAYEAIEAVDEAIDTQNPAVLKEELGDVLLQVVLHSQLAKDAGTFDFEAVCEAISEKLIRRHPHVFGSVEAETAEAVTVNWERIKQVERAENGKPVLEESTLKGISRNQPALSRALDTSKRAVNVGFEWPNLESLWQCVMSEYDEFKAEIADWSEGQPVLPEHFERLESEMGDILFANVNLARAFKIDPEVALTKATAKFIRRFQVMEHLVKQRQEPLPLESQLKALDFETWDDLWNKAKALTK